MKSTLTFTDARIRALLPAAPTKRDLHYDDEQPHLCVRVTAAGSKTFYYLHRNSHGVDFIKLGRHPAMVVETARKVARKTAAQLDLGSNPAEVRRQIRGEPTFGELFEVYITHLEAKGKKRIDDVRATFERYLGSLPDKPVKKHGRKRQKPAEGVNWEGRKASKITDDDVTRLHRAIGGGGKTTTANRVLEIISAIYNVGHKHKLISAMNPAKDVESFPEQERDRHLSTDEVGQFVEALKAEPRDWQDFFMMLLLTGQRLTNVSGMRWRDVDLSVGIWVMSATQTKQNAPITVALTDQAMLILKRRKSVAERDATFVFPADSATGYVTRPQKRWEALIARAGLDNLRKHDLRHTAASWLAHRGASFAVIGAALGHRDIKSTMRYSHMIIDPVRVALQSAHDDALGGKRSKAKATKRRAKGAK